MANYVIEYKQYGGSGYRFLRKPNNDYVVFNSIQDARKKCVKLIKDCTATLCVIRGDGEKLVYTTELGEFVCENRDTGTWTMLRENGTLGKRVNPRAIWTVLVK